jgi:hypothetical protein
MKSSGLFNAFAPIFTEAAAKALDTIILLRI